jgi:hypothetical protein
MIFTKEIRKPPCRAITSKEAVAYLAASGATAITIIEINGICEFRVGIKIDPHAVSVQWISATLAPSIVKQARHDAGRSPNAVTAGRALAQAAADHRQTLTPHDVAMTRARAAADRIDSYLPYVWVHPDDDR